MFTLSGQVQALDIQLAQLGRDFICTSQPPANRLQVRFIGPFQGRQVVWDMQLGTLLEHRLQAHSDSTFPCPFIEIEEGSEGVFPIKVGLDLAVIDEPVIKKTIIMVRNYKRLVIGKIEFCPPVAEG